MRVLTCGLVLGLVASAIVAAPVPKESPAEKLKRIFGTCADPDRNCSFTMQDESLRVRVGREPHRLVPSTGPSNAPRTLRPVAGDFTATARIRILRPLHPEPATISLHAGLTITAEDGSIVYFSRRLTGTGEGPSQYSAVSGAWLGGQLSFTGSATNGPFAAESVLFRMHRTGTVVRFDASEDGKNWTPLAPLDAALPNKVSIGVFAGHDGQSAFEAVFEEFVVTPRPPQ